ncbi:OmpH family outer membrane protein [Granulicella sp. dw_53]|uniref:OmpH family outer membrane protein n=1 Tax=Granulicella sp. dw_53 TaxID=2719792 RepID=UPI001BD370B5|nr:OmpH family outer membrane protein [Granulicella sp. dw_53]
MRRSCRGVFFFGVMCGFGGPMVWAQAAAGQAAGIVVVNFNAAVLQTAEAQRDLGAVEKKFLPRQVALKRLNDEVEASRKQLSVGGDKLSEVERVAREQALNGKEKRLQREAEDFRNDSQAESQEVFQRVAQKVFGVLQEYSQQHGYAAVIERGPDSAPAVWYAASAADITGEIVKAYDARGGLPNSPAVSGAKGRDSGVGRAPR